MLRRFQRSTPNAQHFNEEDFVARQPATQNVKGRRSIVRGYASLSRRLVTTKRCVGGSALFLWLKNGREFIAIYPEEEEREDGDDAGHRQTTWIKKDVIEHDVYDHRPEQGEAKRDEAPSDEQEQTADYLERGNGVN